MTREKIVKICKQCKNKKLDIEQGIICGLTNEKADFEKVCEKFVQDPNAPKEKSSNNNRIENIATICCGVITVFIYFNKSETWFKNFASSPESTILSLLYALIAAIIVMAVVKAIFSVVNVLFFKK